jgi:uncharacterized membrane protein YuzA (DUF378 family)
MKMKKLDELQYIKRGNIFKHCLFTIIGLLLIYVVSLESGVVITSQRNALIMIILFVVSLFCIEMICYDIYPLSEKRQRILYIIIGLFGLGCIIISIKEMIEKEAGFIENQMISDNGAGILIGCFLFSILLAYLIKAIYNKKNEEE